MKKLTCLCIIMATASFLFCGDEEKKQDSIPVTINGTWTLSTIQGAPAAAFGYSGSIVVTNSISYTTNFIIPNIGSSTETGTVALKTGTVSTYTFTPVPASFPWEATISSNGKNLTWDNFWFGLMVFTK